MKSNYKEEQLELDLVPVRNIHPSEVKAALKDFYRTGVLANDEVLVLLARRKAWEAYTALCYMHGSELVSNAVHHQFLSIDSICRARKYNIESLGW